MSAFSYGWGTSNDPHEPFWVRFDACKHSPTTWKEEIYAAARTIANDAGARPLWLCSSGGIDSEVMCDAFFNQGINFSVLTLRQTNDTNVHDIKYAIEWCRSHGVKQKMVELDMESLLKDDVYRYAEEGYLAGGPFRYLQIRMLEIVETMGGYAVLGGGEQLYHVDPQKEKPTMDDAYLDFDVGYSVPLEWCRRNDTSHEPYFYFHTPEVCLAYLQTPLVAFTLEHSEAFLHPNNKYLLKRFVYQSVFPTLENRLKFDGFEEFRPLRKHTRQTLLNMYGSLIQSCKLPVIEMRQQLQGNHR